MPYTTTNDNHLEREPYGPIEAMLQSRFREPVIGLELLKRVMPDEAPIVPASEEVRRYQEQIESPVVPMSEEVRRHQQQVESLTQYRNQSKTDLRLEQIRAQIEQEATPNEKQQESISDV